MALNTYTIALISVGLAVVGLAWAIFWPVRAEPGAQAASDHWDIVHLDDDGVLHRSLVRVIHIHGDTGRMMAWCSRSGCERVFKLSSIVKATDVRRNARIDLTRLARPASGDGPEPPSASEGSTASEGPTKILDEALIQRHQAGVPARRRRVDGDALFLHQHAQ